MRVIFLLLSVIVLPIGYIVLCTKMDDAEIPKAPYISYFCLFGSVGGYLLIAALTPSIVTILILPFLPLAILSLIGSLIYVSMCRPFTRYHLGAVIGCSIVLVSCAIFVGLSLYYR